MCAPDPPAAPDPKATAAAQSGMNRDTAITQLLANSTNQITPDGSLTYQQTGSRSFTDAEGKQVNVPTLTATQTLTPAAQRIYDLTNQTKENISTIGRDQSARIGQLLGTPINIDNEATEARLFDLGTRRLTPQFARDEETLRTRLANSGIMPGSAAWNAEMDRFAQSKNDAFNQLALAGRGQAVQEALSQRNQPINEITALLSGSQVSQPNFVNTPQATVAGVDYAGMVRDKYNADYNAYASKVQQQNAMMGGLFGLAGSLGSMGIYKWSDRRLKKDVHRIGETDEGAPIYSYRYKMGGPFEIGVMAQDIEKIDPAAVATHPSGYKMVDYSRLH